MTNFEYKPSMKEFEYMSTTDMGSSTSLVANNGTLLFHYDNWKETKATITTSDSGNPTTLYNTEKHLRKPNIIIRTGDTTTSPPLANVNLHCFSNKTDITFHPDATNSQSITLQSRRTWSKKPEFSFSSSIFNTTLTWEIPSSWKGSTFVLLTESGTTLARFELEPAMKNFHGKKMGRLELMPEVMERKQEGVDEVVVTAYTVVQYWVTKRTNELAAITTV